MNSQLVIHGASVPSPAGPASLSLTPSAAPHSPALCRTRTHGELSPSSPLCVQDTGPGRNGIPIPPMATLPSHSSAHFLSSINLTPVLAPSPLTSQGSWPATPCPGSHVLAGREVAPRCWFQGHSCPAAPQGPLAKPSSPPCMGGDRA